MKTKLTNLQKAYLHVLITDGPQTLGSYVPQVKRTFDALVAKGYVVCTQINPGWYRYTVK